MRAARERERQADPRRCATGFERAALFFRGDFDFSFLRAGTAKLKSPMLKE
jgi:hypothetical protein